MLPKYFVENILYNIYTKLVKLLINQIHKTEINQINFLLLKKELTMNSIATWKIILGIALSSIKAVTQRIVASSCKI